jgi:hypothetical protein
MAERNLDIVINAKNNAEKELKSLGKSLEANKATIQKTTAVATAAFAGLTAAIGMSVKQYANAGDQVQKMALRTGMSTTALSELKHAAELSGTSLEKIEYATTRANRVFAKADEEGSKMRETLASLGVVVDDLSEMTVEERFMEMAMAVAAVEDPGRRAAAAFDVFGRAGTELMPLLNAGADGIREMREEAHRLGIVFDQEAADSAALFNDNMDRLGKSVDGVKFAVAEAFLPILTQLLEKMVPVITKVQDWIRENPTLTRNILIVVGALTGLVAVLGAVTLIMMTVNPISLAVVAAIVAITAVITAITQGLKLFGLTWSDVWNGIKQVTFSIINAVIAAFEAFINYQIWGLNKLIQAVNRVLSRMASIPGIGKKFAGIQIQEIQKVEFGRVGQDAGTNVNVTVNGDVSGEELISKVTSGMMYSLGHNIRVGSTI